MKMFTLNSSTYFAFYIQDMKFVPLYIREGININWFVLRDKAKNRKSYDSERRFFNGMNGSLLWKELLIIIIWS